MGDVIDIDSNKPHRSGMCRCLHCLYHYAGVICEEGRPLDMECPRCHEMKSRFADEIEPWDMLDAVADAVDRLQIKLDIFDRVQVYCCRYEL